MLRYLALSALTLTTVCSVYAQQAGFKQVEAQQRQLEEDCFVLPEKAEPTAVVTAQKDSFGFLVHEVKSPHNAGPTKIRVLLPNELDEEKKYPVVYVLPVEAKEDSRYGNGLVEVQRHDLHNKHGIIFVAPTFWHLPWYADHPSDAQLRQESYFLDVVMPLVEKTYPVQAGPDGRLLLGFSKSGWGAWSLLLRHPKVFGRAAAWDAPMMMDRLGKYGTAPIFGTQEHFERYRIGNLLRQRAELLTEKRLFLTGYGNFRRDHQQLHACLDELQIPHEYRDGPKRNHDWHSGWVQEAVQLLAN